MPQDEATAEERRCVHRVLAVHTLVGPVVFAAPVAAVPTLRAVAGSPGGRPTGEAAAERSIGLSRPRP